MCNSFGPWLLALALLPLLGCQFAPPGATGSVVPPAAAPTNANPALERRPIGVPTVDPFPCATTAIAAGAAILWAPWPMEGHDLQRTNRSPIVGPRVGRVLWSVEIDAPSFGQVVEAADGTLYVGTESGKLQAVRPGVGVAWSFQASPPVPTPALGPDGSVYLRGGDGALYALRSDGRRRWTTDIGAEPKLLGPAPLVGPDSYSYLTSYHQGLAYLVQPGGFFQWAINTQARTLAGPAVGPDGMVYVGAADGTLRAIDREGLELWRANLAGPIVAAPMVGPAGQIFILIGEGGVELAVVEAGGGVRWRAPRCWQSGALALWAALAADGRVQVAGCAISPSGAEAWRAPIEAAWATPAVLDAEGQAFFGAGRDLYAVGPDGGVLWRLTLDSDSLGPPSIGSGGTLLVGGSRPSRLYAIGGR